MKIFLYLSMLVLFFVGASLVLERGNHLQALKIEDPSALRDKPSQHPAHDIHFKELARENLHHPLSGLLIQILVIFPAAFATGQIFRRLGQPAVTGEIIAGICLGPSVLGFLWPQAYGAVFPPHSLATLRMMGNIGVLIFMFMVGMEFNTSILRQRIHSALFISHASIIVPFFLGLIASLGLYTHYAYQSVSFVVFSLFVGISMSITAFPVLARIIQERNLSHTPLGTVALASAAVDDVTAWTVLAFIVAGAGSGSLPNVFFTLFLLFLFALFLFFIVRPMTEKMLKDKLGRLDSSTLFVSLMILFSSALFTEAIGIHAVFGAFLSGLVMPASRPWRKFMAQRLDFLSSTFLLPFFFAVVGIRTNINLLNGWDDWLTCAAILFFAIIGKFFTSAAVARMEGMDLQNSIAMGALMNTRGLIELIVLNLAFEMGIFPMEIFTILVIMAIVTTLMTGPIVNVMTRQRHKA